MRAAWKNRNILGSLALLSALLLSGTRVEAASIVATSGDTQVIVAPVSVATNDLVDPDAMFVFEERTTTLSGPLALDGGSTIAAGTRVTSFYFHYDQLGNPENTVAGSVTFDASILGVITTGSGLTASDPDFALFNTQYLPASARPTTERGDWVRFSGSVLEYDSLITTGEDNFRVIVAAAGVPDSKPMVWLGLGVAALGSLSQRRLATT